MSFLTKLISPPQEFKAGARLATAAALATNTQQGLYLVATANGALANIDGVAAAVGNRIVVKNEVTQTKNGLYEVADLGTASTKWSIKRTSDADANAKLPPGTIVPVSEGTVNAGAIAVLQTRDVVIGVSNIVWIVNVV